MMDRDFYDNNEYFDDPLKDMEAAASGKTGGETSAARRGSQTPSRTTRSVSSDAYGYDQAPKRVREIGDTGSRKKKNTEKPKKKSKVKTIIICAVVELLTLAAIFSYGYFLRAWNSVTRPEVDEKKIANANLSADKLAEMEKGYFSFVVFGVDGRSASDLVSKGLNSDVILIVNVNMDTGDIRMCSVFRDTYLNISDKDKYTKINAAYCQGGPEQALAAINKNLDLNITNYVTFNWKAVVDGINILGGVDDIDISKSELYYINAFITETVKVTKVGSTQLTHTGPQHLDGVQAVAYGRLRLMDSDFSRVERQKKIIKACFEKAKKANFSVLNNIIVVCFPQVATNINFNDVVYLAQNITKFEIGASGGFPWQRSESFVSSRGDCVVPATLESNVKKLHEFFYDDPDYQVSKAVLRYSEQIKEDTHVYKEGQVMESARTDGGLIPKPKAAEEQPGAEGGESEENGEEETSRAKRRRVTLKKSPDGSYEFPTDADGNVVYETDADGNLIFFEDEDGNIIYPKDADGNSIRPTDADGFEIEEPDEAELPNELDPDAGEEPGDGVEPETLAPGETRPQGPGWQSLSKPTEKSPGPGQGTTAETETESTSSNGPGSRNPEGGNMPGGNTPGDVTPGGGTNAPGGGPGGEMAPGGPEGAQEIGPVVNTGGDMPGWVNDIPGAITPGGF